MFLDPWTQTIMWRWRDPLPWVSTVPKYPDTRPRTPTLFLFDLPVVPRMSRNQTSTRVWKNFAAATGSLATSTARSSFFNQGPEKGASKLTFLPAKWSTRGWFRSAGLMVMKNDGSPSLTIKDRISCRSDRRWKSDPTTFLPTAFNWFMILRVDGSLINGLLDFDFLISANVFIRLAESMTSGEFAEKSRLRQNRVLLHTDRTFRMLYTTNMNE